MPSICGCGAVRVHSWRWQMVKYTMRMIYAFRWLSLLWFLLLDFYFQFFFSTIPLKNIIEIGDKACSYEKWEMTQNKISIYSATRSWLILLLLIHLCIMFVCELKHPNRFEFNANVNFSINNFHVNYISTRKFIPPFFLSTFPTLFFFFILYPAFLIVSHIVLN